MYSFILSYVLTLFVMVFVDLAWAGFLMKDFYRARLSYLLAPTFNLVPLIFFYLSISFAIFYLVSYPAHTRGSLLFAIGAGFLLGFAAYGTYDFTNMATLPNWPLSITIVDVLWGGTVAAITATAGYFLLTWLS